MTITCLFFMSAQGAANGFRSHTAQKGQGPRVGRPREPRESLCATFFPSERRSRPAGYFFAGFLTFKPLPVSSFSFSFALGRARARAAVSSPCGRYSSSYDSQTSVTRPELLSCSRAVRRKPPQVVFQHFVKRVATWLLRTMADALAQGLGQLAQSTSACGDHMASARPCEPHTRPESRKASRRASFRLSGLLASPAPPSPARSQHMLQASMEVSAQASQWT